MIFHTGSELIVITRGRGNLHLLSWQSNGGIRNHVGAIPTENSGTTRFLIGFSHTFERFSFFWDGQGEAVYQIGNRLERKPVGKNWHSASTVNWGSSEVTNTNVTGQVESAVVRDRATTAFIIPDNV
ncbi:hypothetical protein AX16_002508 [Volvariella volvacea WC 439]|nr:hypothetical protein AX16_002508 [Volvariella volvacea WC 439]